MSDVIRYGSPEQALVDEALINFTAGQFSARSFCTTPVELLSADGCDHVLSHGTGFFWRHDGMDFVITNWHVLSGRNPFTGKLLSAAKGFIPDRMKIYGWKISSNAGQVAMLRTGYTIELGEAGKALFAQPPILNDRIVDLVAIPVPSRIVFDSDLDAAGSKRLGAIEPRVNLLAEDKIESRAGDECMITGYPLAHYSGLMLPLWKKGSISTDTNMAVDGIPAFLVDAATSSAMSGSPVFRSVQGGVTYDSETKVVSAMSGYQFLGVYAGRLENAELERVNVGYVWFGSQISGAIAYSRTIWLQIAQSKTEAVA